MCLPRLPAGAAGCAARDFWQSGDSGGCSAGSLVALLDDGPGGRGSNGGDRLALDRWCTLVGVSPHAIARGRADQGSEVEGRRRDGSPRCAQGAAQAAADLARISSEPMAGETQALYQSAKQKNDKLWDGWLQVMEVLDKAEKLAERSGSMFSQATLTEAENLIKQKGSFQEIEKQAQEIAQVGRPAGHAHPAARAVLDAINAARPKLLAALEALTKLDLPTKPYQGEARLAQAARTAKAGCADDRRPDGDTERAGRAEGEVGELCSAGSSGLRRSAGMPGKSRSRSRRYGSRWWRIGLRGSSCVEIGGNPDPALSQGETAQAEVIAALRNGDPDAGASEA